jgi:hypothetical protein
VSSRTAISAAVRARCGPGAVSAACMSARAWPRVRAEVGGGCGPGRGRALPAAGLAVICPRRASQAYQLEMAASLRAALAGDNPASSSCLAYCATCSAVTPVTGCASCWWHQVSHDGARLGRCCGVMPMSRA